MKRILTTLCQKWPSQFASREGLGMGCAINTNNPPLNLLRGGDSHL